ncbi:hypothetical protein Unana1_06878 [Umbelopsis nana]
MKSRLNAGVVASSSTLFSSSLLTFLFHATPLSSRMEYSFIKAVESYVNDRLITCTYDDDDLDRDDLYNRLSEFEDLNHMKTVTCQDNTGRIEELQCDLALMLDQWTAISIVLSSMQETFTESSTSTSIQASDDIWREMRAASDYLMSQIRKLEKRINAAEEQLQDIQNTNRCVATP